MAARKGLFALSSPRPAAEEDDDDLDDLDDYAGDLELDDDVGGGMPPDIGAGPFDDYAATAFDPDADPAARSDALRQAILTIIEERGR